MLLCDTPPEQGWDHTDAWTINDGVATCAPSLGDNVVINGGFDTSSSWTIGDGWSIADGVASKVATENATAILQATIVTGNWYQVEFDAIVNSGYFWPGRFDNGFVISESGKYNAVGLANLNQTKIEGSISADGSVDNVSFRKITLVDMFCTKAFTSYDICLEMSISANPGFVCGPVIGLDSMDNPMNYIVAYIYGSSIYIDKFINGIRVSLISAVVDIAENKELCLARFGNTVRAYYDGVPIGEDVLVENAEVISNTRHGMLSTGNTINYINDYNPYGNGITGRNEWYVAP